MTECIRHSARYFDENKETCLMSCWCWALTKAGSHSTPIFLQNSCPVCPVYPVLTLSPDDPFYLCPTLLVAVELLGTGRARWYGGQWLIKTNTASERRAPKLSVGENLQALQSSRQAFWRMSTFYSHQKSKHGTAVTRHTVWTEWSPLASA